MRIENISTPAILIDFDILKSNQKRLTDIVRNTSMEMYPHYKSHKCTRLAQWQINAGAKGITCAKLSEAQDLYAHGIKTIVIANQVVQPGKISALVDMAKTADITVCADNEENIFALQNACAVAESRLKILVEYEVGMKRCGVESFEEMLRLSQIIMNQPNLTFDGIQAYAGNLAHELDPSVRKEELDKVEDLIARLKKYLEAQGIPVHHICGGSTGTVCDKPKNTVYTQLQTGTYLFMDRSYQRLKLPFKQSLFVACTVVSVKYDRIVVDCGVKSLAMDQVSPVFVGYEGCELSFSEEHTTIFSKDHSASVGDTVLCIPGHCCTTMNNFRNLYLMENRVITDCWSIDSFAKAQ